MYEKRLKKPFTQLSYLGQVRRLRQYAVQVVKCYDIHVSTMDFIRHGENATFKITTKDGAKFLLRIHRGGYHTKEAIQEEINWLKVLSKLRFPVPIPVASKRGLFVESESLEDLGLSRNFCLFRWVDGKFIDKSLGPEHMYDVGTLLAQLHRNAPKTKHRRYWDADGLLGVNAKFGPIDALAAADSKQQRLITKARKRVLARLRRYQANHPERMGLIHADLHFGNLLSVGNGIGAIDFDDCGFGFRVYDLVVPYISMQNLLGEKGRNRFAACKQALIEGYKSIHPWDPADEKVFQDLVTARKLSMLGWLDSRSDNPRLKKLLVGAIKRAVLHIKAERIA